MPKVPEKSTVPETVESAATPVTVAGAAVGVNIYDSYSHALAWVLDTKKKLPGGKSYEITASQREEAFNVDPLVRGIIAPFLKNILFGSYDIITADNKKYAAMIFEQKAFIDSIDLLGAFKEDFEDSDIKYGHSYRRKDYENNLLQKLQRLEPKGMRTYTDPWNSSIQAYHQKALVQESFSSTAFSTKEYNSWFIPGGDSYIPDANIGLGYPKTVWEQFKGKYKVNEIVNLRVDAAERIIAIHKVRDAHPAPIDTVLLEIWLKRLILANGPNFIFRVLSPFLHLQNGMILETTQSDGTKKLISTVPTKPPENMATNDPEGYARQKAIYDSYQKAARDDVDNLVRYLMEGGAFSSGPDKKINVIESGRTISPAFIETMLRILDNNIGMNFGFPVALVQARGSELATSRAIMDLFNTNYAGSKIDREKIADALIAERFRGKKWTFTITNRKGVTETGNFTFEETEAHFKLGTGDVKDQLTIAQTRLATMQGLQVAKALGASRADIQALADEAGIGLLDLEKFDQVPAPGMFGLGANAGAGVGAVSDQGTTPGTDAMAAEFKRTYERVRKELQEYLGD